MPHRTRAITVIGGGLSGTLVAVEILRLTPPEPIHLRLIERHSVIGPGVAYRTRDPHHLLNVRTRSMSMDPREPDHLVTWLRDEGSAHAKTWNATPDPNGFIPRGLYAEYVKDTLERAAKRPADGITLELLPGCHAVAVAERREANSASVLLADGRWLESDAIVLALGNPPPGPPVWGMRVFHDSSRYIGDPWADGALDDIARNDRVLIVGTNLTMVDLVLSLSSRRHAGPIEAISRHGLVASRHSIEPGPSLSPLLDGSPPRLRRILAAMRERTNAHDWRSVVDAFRREVSAAWQGVSERDRDRFLDHVRPFWEIHRHRAPIRAMDEIDRMRSEGRLRIRAARIMGVEEQEDRVTVQIQPRGAKTVQEMAFDRVINATGPQADYMLLGDDPLTHMLMSGGFARRGPHRMGLDATPDGVLLDAHGTPSRYLFTLGPPLRGVLWETTAVPEIREQARALAERLVHRR